MDLPMWETDQEALEIAALMATRMESEALAMGMLREALRNGATGEMALGGALGADDVRALERLERAGASLRTPPGSPGELGWCAQAGSVRALEFLLSRGADANEARDLALGAIGAKDSIASALEKASRAGGRTALEIACDGGRWEAARRALFGALAAVDDLWVSRGRGARKGRERSSWDQEAAKAVEALGRIAGWGPAPEGDWMADREGWRVYFAALEGVERKWPERLREMLERGEQPRRSWHPARALERAAWVAGTIGEGEAWAPALDSLSAEVWREADRPDEWGLGMIADALARSRAEIWKGESGTERLEALRARGARLESDDPGWRSPILLAWRLSKRDGWMWRAAFGALSQAYANWGEAMPDAEGEAWAIEAAREWLFGSAGSALREGKPEKSHWDDWRMEAEVARRALSEKAFAASAWSGEILAGDRPSPQLWIAELERCALGVAQAGPAAARAGARGPRRV